MKKKNYCVDCRKFCNRQAKRCWNCYVKYSQVPENNPNFKSGEYCNHYCIDCGKELKGHGKSKRCNSCANRITSYIDGRTDKKYYCKQKNCNNEISYQNWRIGKGRCYSCAQKNRMKNPQEKQKISKTRIKKDIAKGKNNPNYKGGITPLEKLIRHLEKYRTWQKQVLERDNYTCQDCEQIGGKLNIHHKIPFAQLLADFLKEYDQFSPIEDKETLVRLAMKWKPFWDVNNGRTLCKKCHKKISTRRG